MESTIAFYAFSKSAFSVITHKIHLAQSALQPFGPPQPMGVVNQQQAWFPKMSDFIKTDQLQPLPQIDNYSKEIGNATERQYKSGFFTTTESNSVSVPKVNAIEKMQGNLVNAHKNAVDKNQLVILEQIKVSIVINL